MLKGIKFMETGITDNYLSVFYTDPYKQLMGFGVVIHSDGDLSYIYDVYYNQYFTIPNDNVYPLILREKYSTN